ncbi:MAG: GntR family transcriptional regulator [Candidatus Accumulibacter sp.]|jgi:DNA-binding GntR family transcriptional regulator|nr:GntR family transcriptional regulator [Accumulibacter sp.]
MSSVVFEKVEYQDLNSIVYERIKQKFIDNEFVPGEKLDVARLSESLDVSRTPVVNALKELAQNGFVTICPRSATYVRVHTREEIENIFDFREVMEGLVVHKIIGYLDVARLEVLRDRLTVLQKRGTPDRGMLGEYLDTEMELHEYMLRLCPRIISGKLENLVDLTKRLRKLHLQYLLEVKGVVGLADTEIQIHIDLANALLAGDAKAAERYVRKDIHDTRNGVLEDFEAIEHFARKKF